MKKSCILSLFLLLSLTGCCCQKTIAPVAYGTGYDPAHTQLVESADTISRSLAKLAQVQAAVTLPITTKQLPVTNEYNMTGAATVDWSGPIGDIVLRVANLSNYKLRVLGNPPAIPIIVSVNAHNTPLGDILRDVDFQAGRRANVIVLRSCRTIELQYAHG